MKDGLAGRTADLLDGPASSPPDLSGWRPLVEARFPGWAVIGIFLMLAVAAVAYARFFLMPVVLAFLLALVFSPVRRFLERRGVPAGLSAGLIVGVLIAFLAAAVLALAVPVAGWLDDLPQIGQQITAKVRELRGSAEAVVEAGKQVAEITSPSRDPDVQEVVVRRPGMVSAFTEAAPAIVAQTVLTLVLLLFLLASGDMFYEKVVHVMPTLTDKRRAIRIAFDIERKLSRYLFTITLINAVLGAVIGLAMWVLGLPDPLLFGVLAFALNYIPYLGALTGLIVATVIALITFDSFAHTVVLAAAYLAITTVEGQIITPAFVGRQLEMNTVVVFLSLAFWAWLWSVIGMLVAVPLLVAIRAFCEHVPQLEGLGHFLSARGSEPRTRPTT
jgi:predicted PurR-regulated permease PerM